MELRALEEQVSEMASSYEALRRTYELQKEDELIQSLPRVLFDVQDSNEDEQTDISAAQALSKLESLRDKTNSLIPKMDRYRRRLTEKDPVTGNPRYGATTIARVTSMLATFDSLGNAISIAFGEDEVGKASSSPVGAAEKMRLEVQRQEEAARQAELELEKRAAKEEAVRKAKEESRLDQERRAEEAAELVRRQQREELSRLAQESRRARHEAEQARQDQERQARQEAELADRQWVDSILKGADGVRQQLAVLRESTDADSLAIALNALHTLFSQIVSHPEETNFRRIRRDHPKFHEDIGQHNGGREVLIAAGFRLSKIDDVPCFISTEPNIESDMDAWSDWYDLLKATLGILEEERTKSC